MPFVRTASGKVYNIPEESVLRNLQSGQWHDLGKEAGRVNLVSPAGEIVGVNFDSDTITKALQGGYRFQTNEEHRELVTRQKYGESFGDELAAGVAAFGRGISFGGTDVVIGAVGGERAREALAGWRDANPDASLGMEITGAILPIAVSGGATAPATGARVGKAAVGVGKAVGRKSALKTIAGVMPTAKVSRAARALEQSMARGLESYAARKGLVGLAARAAPKVTAGAAEGAVYGLGQSISEAALSDHEMTAEEILANVGMGAALGGGIPFGAEVLKGAGKKVFSPLKRLIPKGRKVPAIAEEAMPAKPGVYEQISGTVTGTEPRELAKFRGSSPEAKAARHNVMKGDKFLERESYSMANDYTMLKKEFGHVSEHSRGLKPGHTRQLVKYGNEAEVSQAADVVLDDTRRVIQEMIEVGRDQYDFQAYLKRMLERVESTHEKIRGYQQKFFAGGERIPFNQKVYTELDNAKRFLGHFTNRASKSRAISPAGDATLWKLNDMYNEVWRRPMESQELWGSMGIAQSEINQEWTKLLGLYDSRVTRGIRKKLTKATGTYEFNPTFEGDPGAAHQFMKQLHTPENALELKYYSRELDGILEVTRQHVKHYELDDVALKAAKNVEETVHRIKDRIARAGKIVKDQRDFAEISKGRVSKQLGLDVGTAGVGGFVLGGPVGAAIGAGVGTVLDPAGWIRTRAILDRFAGKGGAVRKMAGEVARRTGEAFREITPKARSMATAALTKAVMEPDPDLEMLKARQDITVASQALAGPLITAQAVSAIDRSVKADISRNVAELLGEKKARGPGGPKGARAYRRAVGKQREEFSLANVGKKSHKALWDAFRELVENPEELKERVSKTIEGLKQGDENAVAIAEMVEKKADQAVKYLLMTAPEAIAPDEMNLFSGDEPEVSRVELVEWFNRLRIVEDPMSVFESLHTRQVSIEEGDAMRMVWPRLYQQITGQLIERLTSGEVEVPYQTQVQLSLFMDCPLNQSMRPMAIAHAQQVAGGLTQEGEQMTESPKERKLRAKFQLPSSASAADAVEERQMAS